MRVPPLPTISDIVRLYKLSAAKKLSQNFIMDMTLNRTIVKKAGKLSGAHVCEVGPGPGGITRAILEQDIQHLHVIEKDRRFFPGLKLLSEMSGILTAHHGDVLNFDMENLFPEEYVKDWDDSPPNLHIIGNLPFNVSTPLIIKYLEGIANHTGAWRYGRTRMTLTFQKEVAYRMVAPENDRDFRCRLSVMCQNYCHVDLKKVIPGKAFVPAPDVDVGLVTFLPKKKPDIDLPFKLVEKVNRHLFHHRQKYCKANIATLFPKDQPELTEEVLAETKIPYDKKSYNFNMYEIKKLCHVYDSICKRLPYISNYDYRDPKSKKHYEMLKKLEMETGVREPISEQSEFETNVNIQYQ